MSEMGIQEHLEDLVGVLGAERIRCVYVSWSRWEELDGPKYAAVQVSGIPIYPDRHQHQDTLYVWLLPRGRGAFDFPHWNREPLAYPVQGG